MSASPAPGAQCGVAARASGVYSSDAPPSNRASDSCIDGTFQLLSRHVDSLELSYQGSLSIQTMGVLDERKRLAQSRSPAHQLQAQYTLGDQTFAVLDKGAGFFPYVLDNGYFRIKLSRPGKGAMPLAHCQIRSEYLAHVGPNRAEQGLRSILMLLGADGTPETVSRIDLAADFSTDTEISAWDAASWVTRIRYKQAHWGERFTGWSIGRGCPVVLRLYDKTVEIENVSKKFYLHEIWKRAGWFVADHVWRVEGQFRREALKKFGLRTLSDCLYALDGLWQHLTAETVRLVELTPTDQTRGRWKNRPLWNSINAVEWDSAYSTLTRAFKASNLPADEYIAVHGTALLTAIMAREGVLETGFAWNSLKEIVLAYHRKREFFTDLSPEEALIERAQLKGRKFGTLKNIDEPPPAKPPLTPEARAYRKAKDGE